MKITVDLNRKEEAALFKAILDQARSTTEHKFAQHFRYLRRTQFEDMLNKALGKAIRHLARDYFEGEILELVQTMLWKNQLGADSFAPSSPERLTRKENMRPVPASEVGT